MRPAVDTLMSNSPEARLHVRHVAVGQAQLRAVLGVHVQQRLGQRSVELGHAPGHGARVPVLQQASGAEVEGVLVVGLFGRRLVGAEHHGRLGVGRLVEAQAAREVLLSVLRHAHLVEAVFLRAVAEAPERGQPLPVHFAHGPGEAVVLDVQVVGGQLLCLHLQLRAERAVRVAVDGRRLVVEAGVGERAVLLPDGAAHFALVALEVAGVLVVPFRRTARRRRPCRRSSRHPARAWPLP